MRETLVRSAMTVLVTGNLGYIGSVLTLLLAQRGYPVRGLDSGLFRDCLVVPAVDPEEPQHALLAISVFHTRLSKLSDWLKISDFGA